MAKQESQINITVEEMERFQKAMKSEEFRKMFTEYAKEISDPENRKKYEEEIAQLEAERGMDVKFINPQDGFVVKTSIKSEGGMKAFINICQSDVVNKATCKDGSKKVDERNVKGQEWSIPYSLNQPREDLDKAGKKCTVYDIIFHTKTYEMGQEDPRFKQLILDTTFDAIEGNWKIKLDRKNLKYPKMKFKGTKTSTIIRTSNDEGVKNAGVDIEIGDKKLSYPYKNGTPDRKEKTSDVKDKTNESSSGLETGLSSVNHSSTTPKYSIVHRGYLDLQNFTNARDSRASTRPQELIVNIELPLCETSAGVDLDIFEKQVVVDSSDPNYHLDITLPYPVSEDEGRAQFDKSKRTLIVTLPVVPAPPIALNGYADDEAAESKVNGLVTEIVNDKVDCGLEHVVNIDDDGNTDSNDNGGGHGNENDGDSVNENDGGGVNENAGGSGNENDGGGVNENAGGGGNENDGGGGDENDGGGVNENDGDSNNVDHNCDGSVKDIENRLNTSLDVSNADVSMNGCKDVVQEQRTNKCFGVPCSVFKTPPYSFHQNNESVTFVLHVSGVSLDTMSLGFNGNKCCISFPSTSITSTNFLSPGYALYIQFPDECLIDSEKSSVDLNETNLVLVLYKQVNCVGTWQWFMIGSDEHTLEKKVFLTEETLQESLNEVKDNWAQQPITCSHKVESTSEEETVIQVDVKSENFHAADTNDMGNILAGADELLFSEVKDGSSDTVMDNVVQGKDEIKNDTLKDCNILNAKDDTVMINYADLDEVEFIEENYDENEADGLNETQRLSTVQEIDPTNEVNSETTTGDIEMQRARAIKCRKNRRRRRRSTGSHDQSSSISEEEGDGSTRRGKQREKHARHSRMSRSLSFGSSADSHDDIEHDGHRCVRFNPVPEIHVFSNRADKRKWKELRKQQLLDGNTELDNTQPKTYKETICKLKSSLKDTRSSTSDKESQSVSSDDGNTVHGSEVAISNGCEDADKDIFIVDDSLDDGEYGDGDDGHNDDGDNLNDDDDDDDDSFVKLEKPQLTNTLIFDLDD